MFEPLLGGRVDSSVGRTFESYALTIVQRFDGRQFCYIINFLKEANECNRRYRRS